MYQIEEYVMTAQDGLCQIKNIVEKDFLGEKKEYYELSPVANGKATSYVPVQNDGRMRSPISREDATHIIEIFETIEPQEVKNEKQRADLFKEITKAGEVESCIALWKHLYTKKIERMAESKMLPSVDDRYYRHICSFLYNELAYSLDREASEIEAILVEKMK